MDSKALPRQKYGTMAQRRALPTPAPKPIQPLEISPELRKLDAAFIAQLAKGY